MNKIFFVSCLLILLTGCVQDSPNIKQIENLQFFIDNKSDNRVTEIESKTIDIDEDSILLVNLLKESGMIASVSEGNRLIEQGGIKINSEKVSDSKFEIDKGTENIYQVGKRKFLKIKIWVKYFLYHAFS